MKQYIDEQNIASLAYGAMFLGSGGGGDTTLLQLMTKQVIRELGAVRLLSPFEFSDDGWAIPVAIMGSPTIFSEKLSSGYELKKVFTDLEKEKRIAASAVTGLEIGGINALTPVLTAALTGHPLLDADGMGRAFPELHMTTFHAFEKQASPLFMCNNCEDSHRITLGSNRDVEKEAREKVTAMGGWAAIALYPMKGHEVQETGILHTFSLAMRLGDAVITAGTDAHRVVSTIFDIFRNSIYGKPFKLIEGKVVDLQRNIVEGLLSGKLIVEGIGFHSGEQVELLFQNEYLLAKQGSRPIATVPDLICVLDGDTGYPIMIEELENNMRVWVIAIPSPVPVRNPKMVEAVGPKQFGLSYDFVPVEKLRCREGEGSYDVPLRY